MSASQPAPETGAAAALPAVLEPTPGVGTQLPGRAAMRFHVDAWDPGYGTSAAGVGPDTATTATVLADVEVAEVGWAPMPAAQVEPAPVVLFVDGVRRVDARAWIDRVDGGPPAPGLCASFAAGAVCCRDGAADVLAAEARRGLFTAASPADDIVTVAGTYAVTPAPADDVDSLSLALQRRLADLEVVAAVAGRDALPTELASRDLLVVDGPLRGRQHLPRALGFVKSQQVVYLPPPLNEVVGRLGTGERTPVFRMGTTWDRHSWYLRLPCRQGAAWAGVVRVECSADLPVADVVRLADLSQATLCRYASVEYKDARAPQNLFPVAGLERHLRRRLGDRGVLYRALLQAAG